ncbi:MAG: hypothetical protein A3J24_09085 [Deltaproteobacteria bacterium RIFCSPLOWO2_02_FULL_53_8]|nr:MAG: hypothetical protein A3J24_09085 [Deltaproteobacteria bacterium RIFCSPLOWO2_02_FULL_53_8]
MKDRTREYLRNGSAVVFSAVILFFAVSASGVRADTQTDVKGAIDQRRVINPSTYGDIIMKTSLTDSAPDKPVVFKHWTHRTKYTCNVCHTDLGFPLKANTVEIKQADIDAGKYCGACHDGKTAFGRSECAKCHSYGLKADEKKIDEQLAGLPKDGFGNKVNWVAALQDRKITPAASLPGKPVDKEVKEGDVVIPVTKFSPHPPDVLFSHKVHTEQLHCSSCHPVPFVAEKGANPDRNMIKIISGQYCGVCHDRVSFPLNDCFRCHSQPVQKIEEPEGEDKKGVKKD